MKPVVGDHLVPKIDRWRLGPHGCERGPILRLGGFVLVGGTTDPRPQRFAKSQEREIDAERRLGLHRRSVVGGLIQRRQIVRRTGDRRDGGSCVAGDATQATQRQALEGPEMDDIGGGRRRQVRLISRQGRRLGRILIDHAWRESLRNLGTAWHDR